MWLNLHRKVAHAATLKKLRSEVDPRSEGYCFQRGYCAGDHWRRRGGHGLRRHPGRFRSVVGYRSGPASPAAPAAAQVPAAVQESAGVSGARGSRPPRPAERLGLPARARPEQPVGVLGPLTSSSRPEFRPSAYPSRGPELLVRCQLARVSSEACHRRSAFSGSRA
jgi:hypothetical protein